MDNVLAVHVLNGRDELLHDGGGLLLTEVAAAADALEEFAARQQLHDDVGVEVVLEHVVQLDDVLVALALAQVLHFAGGVVLVAREDFDGVVLAGLSVAAFSMRIKEIFNFGCYIFSEVEQRKWLPQIFFFLGKEKWSKGNEKKREIVKS